jgi:hypothetical protein
MSIFFREGISVDFLTLKTKRGRPAFRDSERPPIWSNQSLSVTIL